MFPPIHSRCQRALHLLSNRLVLSDIHHMNRLTHHPVVSFALFTVFCATLFGSFLQSQYLIQSTHQDSLRVIRQHGSFCEASIH